MKMTLVHQESAALHILEGSLTPGRPQGLSQKSWGGKRGLRDSHFPMCFSLSLNKASSDTAGLASPVPGRRHLLKAGQCGQPWPLSQPYPPSEDKCKERAGFFPDQEGV